MKDDSLHSISRLTPEEIETYLKKLQTQRDLYINLLEVQSEGIILTSLQGEIVYSNKKANEILNFELLSLSIPFFKYFSNSTLRQGFEKSLNENITYSEEFRLDKDEKVSYIKVQGTPYDANYLYIIQDVTERKKELYELKRLESLAAVTSVASLLAHDIGNPLSSISIQSDLIKHSLGKKSDEFIIEHIDIIKDEIERIKSIVRNFLYSAKPLEVKPVLHNTESLIDGLIKFITPTLQENGIALNTDIQHPLPYLEYDFDLIYNCLLNLVKNSIEALTEVAKKEITINASRVLNNFVVSIADTGAGISDADLENIFKPYFTTKKTGTGLGLTNVYKIVKLHGGNIRAEQLKKGAKFTISLPLGKESNISLDFKN